MKNVIVGLIIGIVLSGVTCMLMLPKIKQASFDSGYAAGNKEGISTGTIAGISQGVEQVNSRIKHEQDSVAEAKRKQEAKRKAAYRPKKIEKPTQNWHVIDGKIAEPIKDDQSSEE